MLCLLLNNIVCATEASCKASASFPLPLEGAKLLHLSVWFTNGESTSNVNYLKGFNMGNWSCDDKSSIIQNYNPAPEKYHRNYKIQQDPRFVSFPPTCAKNDVTNNGMKQLYDLGKQIKNHYSEKVKQFYPENANPTTLYAKTPDMKANLKSTMALIQGLFDSTNDMEVSRIIADTKLNKLMSPDAAFCEDVKKNYEDFMQNGFKSIYNDFSSKVKATLDSNKIELSESTAFDIASFFSKASCSSHKLPDWASSAFADACKAFVSSYLSGINSKPIPLSSSVLREIFRILDHRLLPGPSISYPCSHSKISTSLPSLRPLATQEMILAKMLLKFYLKSGRRTLIFLEDLSIMASL